MKRKGPRCRHHLRYLYLTPTTAPPNRTFHKTLILFGIGIWGPVSKVKNSCLFLVLAYVINFWMIWFVSFFMHFCGNRMKVMEFILVDLVCFFFWFVISCFCNIVGSLVGILGLEMSFICSVVKQVEKFCLYGLHVSMIWFGFGW